MAPDTSAYGTGIGLSVQLTNHGFGIGGYYSRLLNEATSVWVEANLGAGKHEREQKLFNRFGSGFIPDKRSYLLMLPVAVGAQRRLFRTYIEDNFRPYVQLSGGPTFGWAYPYFDDVNGNGRFETEGFGEERFGAFSSLPRGDLYFGLGGTVAVGAYFGYSRSVTQGVRFGYTFTYFFDAVPMLESDIPEADQRYFGTPVISLTFGRLFGP